MPEIQNADVGRKLQERYDLVGPPPAPFLAPDVSPVVIVDDLTGIDTLESTFERRYVAQESRTGSVGNRAIVRMINPVGSGVLVNITRVGFDVAIASPVRVSEPIDIIGVILIPGVPTDGRVTGRGAAGLGNGLTAGLGDGQLFLGAAAAVVTPDLFMNLGYLIVPGQMISFTQQISDDTMSATVFWTERNHRSTAGGGGGGL